MTGLPLLFSFCGPYSDVLPPWCRRLTSHMRRPEIGPAFRAISRLALHSVKRIFVMINRSAIGYKYAASALAVLFLLSVTGAKEYISGKVWPEPKIVDPGPVGAPPSDAIALFSGNDMSAWEGGDKWEVANGVATAKGGGITSKQSFGDCQLHVEWAEPSVVTGSGQGRGNSGVYIQGMYEVQILDSYDNKTYFDGQCGSIYKQTPPLVNACRKPGEWQSYDIIFEAPKFDDSGKLTKPAYRHCVAKRCADSEPLPDRRSLGLGRVLRNTRRTSRNCRYRFSSTVTRCASAISGFASCKRLETSHLAVS